MPWDGGCTFLPGFSYQMDMRRKSWIMSADKNLHYCACMHKYTQPLLQSITMWILHAGFVLVVPCLPIFLLLNRRLLQVHKSVFSWQQRWHPFLRVYDKNAEKQGRERGDVPPSRSKEGPAKNQELPQWPQAGSPNWKEAINGAGFVSIERFLFLIRSPYPKWRPHLYQAYSSVKLTGIISLTSIYFESGPVHSSNQLNFSYVDLRVNLSLRVSDIFTKTWIGHLDIYVNLTFKLCEVIFLINFYKSNWMCDLQG